VIRLGEEGNRKSWGRDRSFSRSPTDLCREVGYRKEERRATWRKEKRDEEEEEGEE